MRKLFLVLVALLPALAAQLFAQPSSFYVVASGSAQFTLTYTGTGSVPAGQKVTLLFTPPLTGNYSVAVSGGGYDVNGVAQGWYWLQAGKTYNLNVWGTSSWTTLSVAVNLNGALLGVSVKSLTLSPSYSNATLSAAVGGVAYGVSTPSGFGVSNPKLTLTLTFMNTVLNVVNTNAASWGASGSSVTLTYNALAATPQLTVVLAAASPDGLTPVYVEGMLLPSDAVGILSPRVSSTPGLTVKWRANGTLFDAPQLGGGDVYVYGISTPNVTVVNATGPGFVFVAGPVRRGLKYYQFTLVKSVTEPSCDGCWDLDSAAWGNRTLYLKVNGTTYAFPPEMTQGSVALVPWFGVAGAPFAAPGAVSVVVNDTAKTVVVKWGNKAGKLSIAHAVLYYDNATGTASLAPSQNTKKVLTAAATSPALMFVDTPITKLEVGGGSVKQIADKVVALSAGSSVTVFLRTTLNVTVRTVDGKPVEGAQVNVYDEQNRLVAGRGTDASGRAVFVLTPGANYIVEVTSGSEVQTQFVSLADDTAVSFTVTQVPPKPLLTTETVLLIMFALAVVAVVAVLVAVSPVLRRSGNVFVVE